jgi:caffeoyl-CoA O-methyltransferase
MSSSRSPWLQPGIEAYADAHTTPPDRLQRALVDETRAKLADRAQMQISPLQGSFMELFVRAMGARRAIEVGTFTGYSSLAVARGLPDDGQLICCDVSEEWTSIARRFWEEAGVSHKIELRLGPAVDTLRALPAGEQFDVGFIDADKPNYPIYFDEIVTRLRPGGVVMIDNVLWSGRVADQSADDETTKVFRAFNEKVVNDVRVTAVMLPISDGLTLVQKK